MRDRISDAIDLGDLDELLRIVDALCDTRDWELLVALRDRSLRALERGRQLWPAASYAEYRLALDAPAEFAASVLVEDAGQFAIGPLSEVAAATHTWEALAEFARPGPVAALAAHERVLRGEQIDAATVEPADVLGVPLRLERWEPEYALATYEPARYEAPAPLLPRGRPLSLPDEPAKTWHDDEVESALRDVVRTWTARSEGTARIVAVEGDAESAIAATGARDVRAAWLDPAEALALLAWAGASSGRYGRRRGAASGRDLAWAAAGALCGFRAGERHEPEALGDAISELHWYVWHGADVSTGWVLRLAVEDPVDGVAWACDAVDPA